MNFKLIRIAIPMALALSSLHQSAAQTPTPREEYAELNGVRLWFKDTGGKGTPVVFLHAATGVALNWEYQIPAVTKAGYRFIAYDRRGRGKSVITDAASQSGTDVDDLHALMKYLGVDQFHLIGTAAGGGVAVDYVLSFPEQVRSLVIANSLAGVRDESYLELGRRLRPSQFAALPPELRELGPSYRAANPEGARRWVELERQSRQAGTQAVATKSRNQITLSQLETIRAPTLLMTGGADLYMPPPVLRMLASHIKNAKVEIIPEVGHSAYWEQPEIFNDVILRHLNKQRTTRLRAKR